MAWSAQAQAKAGNRELRPVSLGVHSTCGGMLCEGGGGGGRRGEGEFPGSHEAPIQHSY